jgi:serine/threonine protein kinase
MFFHAKHRMRWRDYDLLQKLGEGGMADVWLARCGDEHVAIKQLKPALSQDPIVLDGFSTEAKLMQRLQHPHVVQVLDVSDPAVIVMEWMRGGDLGRRRLSLAETIAMARDIACGLAHAHALGVIHRDVTPSNILFSADGTAKIADFGVARAPGVQALKTTPGVIKGKYSYMSPEQIGEGELDPRTDVFSLGVVIVEAAMNAHPFRRKSRVLTQQAIIKDEAPVLDAVPCVAAMLEKNAARRPTMAEAYASLAALASDLGAARASMTPVSAAAIGRRRGNDEPTVS